MSPGVMEILSTVPVVYDRTMLLFKNEVTAGRSMVSVTGLYIIGTTVTGVITFNVSSEAAGLRLQALVETIIQISNQ
jgi:hypothetical protein